MNWQLTMHKKSEKWADNVLTLKRLSNAVVTAVQNEKVVALTCTSRSSSCLVVCEY